MSTFTERAHIKERVVKGLNRKFEESMKIIGHITIEHKNANGDLIELREIKNLVVSAGKAGIASRINGSGSEAVFTTIAIGTGSTAAAAGDTALGTEITTNGGQRGASDTIDRTTISVTNDAARLIKTFTFTGSFAVTEAGILNNVSSGGTLLARQVFAALNVVSTDTLTFTWRLQVS